MTKEELIKKLTDPKDNQAILTDEEVHYVLGDWIKQHFNVDVNVHVIHSFKIPHIKVTLKK